MAAVNGRRIRLGPRPARDPGAEAWVRGSEAPGKGDVHTARLTVDVTPGLRGRIKVIAFQRGLTVAEMLRALLEHEYGEERSEEHTSELQSLMRISYAVYCLKKKNKTQHV